MLSNYPPGTENHPSAPWNQSSDEFRCTVLEVENDGEDIAVKVQWRVNGKTTENGNCVHEKYELKTWYYMGQSKSHYSHEELEEYIEQTLNY